MMFKRIAALIAAILFILCAVAALVMAVIGAPVNYVMAAMLCLVLIPIFFYAMNLITRALQKDPE